MKKYIKPVILSQEVLEKAALECTDYAYYTKMTDICYDEFIGTGKFTSACAVGNSSGFSYKPLISLIAAHPEDKGVDHIS